MKSILTRAALLLVMASPAVPASAQFERMPGAVKQIEVGYGFSYLSGDYKIIEKGVTSSGDAKDTTLTTSIHSRGVTYNLGTSLPLKRLGRISSLQLGITGMYSAYLWDFGVPTGASLSDTGFHFDYSGYTFGGLSVTAGAAITADFKFGVDAMMDKNLRWGWTGGIGVLPSVNWTTDNGLDATYAFGIQPVLKSEVSLRAGIVMKLRLQYAFGSITYLDHSGDGYFVDAKQQTQIIGKSNFTVSYLLMPFSFMYKKSEWFNSY